MGSLEDHVYACDEAELKVLLVDAVYVDRAGELRERRPSVERVFTFGAADVGDELEPQLEATPPPRLRTGARDPEEISWLLYTGGTTGVPKAAMLPERASPRWSSRSRSAGTSRPSAATSPAPRSPTPPG